MYPPTRQCPTCMCDLVIRDWSDCQIINMIKADSFAHRFVTIEECVWGAAYPNHPSYAYMNRLCPLSATKWSQPADGTCPLSDWSTWSPCDANCGPGLRYQQLHAHAHAFAHTRARTHSHTHTRTHTHTVVAVSQCSHGVVIAFPSLLLLRSTRVRYSLPPSLQTTSAACSANAFIQSQPCTATACSGTCTYTAWTSFGACSKTCGGGTQMSTRTLSSGPATCGPFVQTQLCNTQACV